MNSLRKMKWTLNDSAPTVKVATSVRAVRAAARPLLALPLLASHLVVAAAGVVVHTREDTKMVVNADPNALEEVAEVLDVTQFHAVSQIIVHQRPSGIHRRTVDRRQPPIIVVEVMVEVVVMVAVVDRNQSLPLRNNLTDILINSKVLRRRRLQRRLPIPAIIRAQGEREDILRQRMVDMVQRLLVIQWEDMPLIQ